MKHNLLQTANRTANGFSTPPCGNSHGKSQSFSFSSLLIFLMLTLGSVNIWAQSYFISGSTIYLRVTGDCKNWAGWYVSFYYAGSSNIAYGQNNYVDNLWTWSNVDYSTYLNSGLYTISSEVSSSDSEKILSFTIPTDGTNNIDCFRIWRPNSAGASWLGTASAIVSASDVSGTQNQIHFSAWDNPSGTWETYSSGGCITSACGSGGVSDPESDQIETHYIAGEGWTGATWLQKDLAMTALGSDMAYYFIPAEKITGQIKFKLNPESSNSGWDKQLNSNAIDNSQNYSNVNLTSVDGSENRITLSETITGAKKNDIYIFTNGTKVWAIAVPIFSSQLPDENTAKPYTMMDLRLKEEENNDWKGYDKATRFTDKADNDNSYTKHTLAYIIPAVGSGETDASGARVRIEYYDGSQTCKKSNKEPGIAITSSPKRAIVLWDGSSTSPADPLIVDYPVRKSGWKLYVNGSLVGTTDANGDVLVSNLSAGNVTFYLTNGETSKLYQGINWFGGLYIKRSSCSGVSLGEQQYGKGSGKNGIYKKPIVASYNPTGKFTLSQASDVTFNFDGGDITINAVDHVETFTDEVYVYGAGGTNWVTDWSKPVEAYKMTISGGVASKTFYNVTGDGLNFKVWNKTTSRDIDWSMFSSSKSENISCNNCSANNICFNLGSNVYDVTVYTNGTEVWVKAKQHKASISGTYCLTGDFNSWSNTANSMIWSNDIKAYTYTMRNVTSEYTKNGHGWKSFKIVPYSSWDNQIHGTSATILVNGVIEPYNGDNECDECGHGTKVDNRILVPVDEASDIIFAYYEYTDNTKIVNITVTPAADTPAADPSLQPWSEDSYRDWYLTGDFTKPNEFDGWIQNPSEYKFVADGDNYQTVSITLDPNDASRFYDYNGHKLTRFEIIRQGTWDDPRINKPQFDAASSNCSLQTDWREAGSNRMSLELTVKSVIKFDIWRWGTTPGSADRKVTVTITPVPQVTVTFMANGETFATQTFDKGAKATTPSGTPVREGCNFNGWDWDFNTNVNENTTVNATWAYKAISSISLSESEHMTWVGNTDFALTYTPDPSDAIAKSVTWNSSNTSVATVSDGTVTAVSAGTATITCTVTDQFNTPKTATCVVTVAACEMVFQNLYSMTVTGYNSSTGSSATLTDLWDESSNNGVMAQNARLVRIAFKDLATEYMTEDADGKVAGRASISDNSDKWMYYSAGTGLFYLQNYKTGHYLYKDKSTDMMGPNGEWKFYGTKAAAYSNADTYRWLENDSRICNKDGYNNGLNGSHTLMRYYVDAVDGWNTPYVRCGLGGHQGNNPIKAIITQVEASVANPFYVASQMNTSYYRMNTNATVRANLGDALVSGAVITVRLYADAATTVKLTKTNGTEVETIDLTADTEREYTYTVASNSALLGESAFIIKASDHHAGIASIVVTRTYAVSLAKLIEETKANGTLTLSCDYPTDNAVINKAITINGGGHTIGNLTVEQTGDLTLGSALTVNDFTICAKAGNTSTDAASGQVHDADNLTVNGNAYFLYTVDPSGTVHYGWYDFTVPFPVNATSGIKGYQNGVLKENFANGVDYAIMDYNGGKQGQGQYPYKKFSGVMQPNQLYSITLDDEYNYNTLRMQKTADGALVASNTVTLNAYSGDATHQNWNGVGNGTLHHADADYVSSHDYNYVQVYQSGDKTFLPVEKSQYSFVVGTAFMVQETGSMTLNQATHDRLLAPKRYADVPATAIQIAREGQPFSDQLFITASETGGQTYTPGVDVAKAGDLGSANVPQIWTNAYNSALCVHEAQLIDGEAQYNLSLYAPAAGTYTLTSLNIPADHTLYLTQNGTTLCNLNETYTLDLNKGVTTEYGLLLVESHKMPTGIENNEMMKGAQKIMHNGVLYIRHNGKVYNAHGAEVK